MKFLRVLETKGVGQKVLLFNRNADDSNRPIGIDRDRYVVRSIAAVEIPCIELNGPVDLVRQFFAVAHE